MYQVFLQFSKRPLPSAAPFRSLASKSFEKLINQEKENKKQNLDDNWFSKLTEPKNNAEKLGVLPFKNMPTDQKRIEIERTWKFYRDFGYSVPSQLSERCIEVLLECESYSHLKNTFT